jgi:hypothetical protein
MKNKPKSSLYKVLKGSYRPVQKQAKSLKKEGYEYDTALSNHNQQVYYHPKTKKMVVAVTGTHNLSDVGTDLAFGAGMLKHTHRYKQAERRIIQAKEKYKPEKTTITGHSLGGAIARRVAKSDDTVITYNKASTIGEKPRANETAIRTRGDIPSFFAKVQHQLPFRLYAHTTGNLRHSAFSV